MPLPRFLASSPPILAAKTAIRMILRSPIMTIGVFCEIIAFSAAAWNWVDSYQWLPNAALTLATVGAVIVASRVAWDYHGRGLNEKQREELKDILTNSSLNETQMDEIAEAILSSGLTPRQKSDLPAAIRAIARSFCPPKSALARPTGEPLVTTTADSLQIVPQSPPSAPALRAADQGVASALESVLSDNTRRVYGAQWRLFTDWWDDVDLSSLPAEPLTVARYLAARAGGGASIATMHLATSAITKAHEWAGYESPARIVGCAPR